jgi:hypothetical protein
MSVTTQPSMFAVWQKIVDHPHGGSEVDAVVVIAQGVQSTTAQQRHQTGGECHAEGHD